VPAGRLAKGRAVQEPAIVFDQVSYRYAGGRRPALAGLSLSIEKGEFVALLGENGAGKSTFCQMLNGVIPTTRGGWMHGRVTVAGLDTQAAGVVRLASRVGIVLEDPETQLFTTSVLNEVAFGPENLGIEPAEILRRAAWALDVVALAEYRDHPPAALSGGQKQRLAIAAALAMMPEILVLDEATSQLDPVGTMQVLSIVQELNRTLGMTIVMATDKGELVAEFCNRVLVLHQGELVADGTSREVFADEDLLARVVIRSPQVSQLATYLADGGYPLAHFPITLAEACADLVALLDGPEDL
jgi:energy-coupling factor transporter ATP-binding protein EcfA2